MKSAVQRKNTTPVPAESWDLHPACLCYTTRQLLSSRRMEKRAEAMQRIARDYWSVWKQFVLQGALPEDVLPPAVLQSWRRCAALGIDPYGKGSPADHAHFTSPTISQTLLSLVRPAMEDLHQFVEGSACVVVFADTGVRIV